MSLQGNISLIINTTFAKESDLSKLSDSVGVSQAWQIADGTAADQANIQYDKTITLTDSSNFDLDLTNITNQFGEAQSIVNVKSIYIKPAAANTSSLIVGNSPTNPIQLFFGAVTDTVTLDATQTFYMEDRQIGWPVADGSADILRFTHDGTTTDDVIFNVIIIGTDA